MVDVFNEKVWKEFLDSDGEKFLFTFSITQRFPVVDWFQG